jgi:hypothetical protein
MKSIKLKSLLPITEQAPQPPLPDLGAPMGGAPVPPPAQPGLNAGDPNNPQQPETPPTPDTSPTPENPSEYDFTKDFRAFEDKKNKAESDAKKVLLEKMNGRLLNKTIVANASRGYGQPKTDYTIKNVKKISVEFWYKDYVVIATDENDKKYFLTPGINIKIEGEGSEPAPGGKEEEKPEQNDASGGEPSDEENPQQPAPQGGTPPPQPEPQENPNGEAPQDAPAPKPQAKPAPKPGQPQVPGEEEDEEQPPKKLQEAAGLPILWSRNKGMKIIPEIVQRNIGKFFEDQCGIHDIKKYIKKTQMTEINDRGRCTHYYELEIPNSELGVNFSPRDLMLEFKFYRDRNSNHSIKIEPVGRHYIFEINLKNEYYI